MKNKIITFLQLLPVFLSIILISAHFYRANEQYLAYILIATPFLLIIKKKFIARGMQVILFLSTIEWWTTVYKIIQIRRQYQMPWMRFGLIMGSVAVFTLLSIIVFETKILKRIYK